MGGDLDRGPVATGIDREGLSYSMVACSGTEQAETRGPISGPAPILPGDDRWGDIGGAALDTFDLVVVGGGMGGLATATLAQRIGMRVALLESHTKLGGCAGHFGRGVYHFDAGATALMGLNAGEPIGDLLDLVDLDFEGELTPGYRVCLPDREVTITPDVDRFLADVARVFPGNEAARRGFLNLQGVVGDTLFEVASRVPRLPFRSFEDARHNLRILGLRGIAAAATWLFTVDDVLRLFGLAQDRAFRAWVAMLLQDTAQAGPETVPFANAAACIQAYRKGMSRPRGGMRALAEGLGQRLAELGGDLRTGTLAESVERRADGLFEVRTRRRQTFLAMHVAFNLPLDLAARLLGRSLDGRLGRQETKSRAQWSAFTAYLAFDRDALPDDTPLFHQVLQDYGRPIHDGNNALISLSPVGDEGYGPEDVRVATMSTHTRPADWEGLDSEAYRIKKSDYESRMLAALRRALPGAAGAIRHAEFASPRSFRRYTRRQAGAVGGPPVSRGNSTFLAVGPDALGPGLWLVGDSVFPGQGTMATVLSGIRVVERIAGIDWPRMSASGSPEKLNGRRRTWAEVPATR